MNSEKTCGSRYIPLHTGDEGPDEDECDRWALMSLRTPHAWTNLMFRILLLSSLAINAFWTFRYLKHESCQFLSPYVQMAYDDPVTYRSYTEYWDPKVNESFSNDVWDAIDTDPVAIALSKDEVEHFGLAESTPFPWDTDRSIYYIKGLHDMHCLKLLHRSVVASYHEEVQLIKLEHLLHCLDGLRQDIMCVADDTPMPAAKPHLIGDGQVRQCRDWNKLLAWATEPDRHACHKFDDYREVIHTLELFAFCPVDSPYLSTMQAYFEFHGHRDPFEE